MHFLVVFLCTPCVFWDALWHVPMNDPVTCLCVELRPSQRRGAGGYSLQGPDPVTAPFACLNLILASGLAVNLLQQLGGGQIQLRLSSTAPSSRLERRFRGQRARELHTSTQAASAREAGSLCSLRSLTQLTDGFITRRPNGMRLH